MVQNVKINFFSQKEKDFISLTDIAKYKNSEDPRFVVQNWMKTRYTVDFLGIWETIHNPNFNRVEFDTFKITCFSKVIRLVLKIGSHR